MKRGDVYNARLEPHEGSEQGGDRPVVVMSRDSLNQYSPVVVVVPITDRANKTRSYPSHAVLKAGDGGLKLESLALAEQVRAISTTRLVKYLGHLPPQRIAEVGAVLRIVLDL